MTTTTTTTTPPSPVRHALLVCDVQAPVLSVMQPLARREALLYWIRYCLHLAREHPEWIVVWSGLRFAPGYQGLHVKHKLFGSLARLHAIMGEAAAHWFLPGYPEHDLEASLACATNGDAAEAVFWRQQHVPPTEAVLQHLTAKGVTHVTLVGVRLSHSVQLWAQYLCDASFEVTVVTHAVADEPVARQDALLEHLLPTYARVTNVTTWTEDYFGLETARRAVAVLPAGLNVAWVCETGRGGHGPLWRQHLLQHAGFQPYPRQRWYTSTSFLGTASAKEYHCPLGQAVVDLCDEPQFSQVSMYVAGREHLDEKDKLVALAGRAQDKVRLKLSPDTYLMGRDQTWLGEAPPATAENGTVWFLKETDKNGGKAVTIHASAAECRQASRRGQTYVAQRHLPNPLLTSDGYKCHVKFYILLTCDADGTSWTLYTYRDSFLSVAEAPWNAQDTSADVQITTLRNYRLKEDAAEPLARWPYPHYYRSCQEGVVAWIKTAIAMGCFQGRTGQRQFEIFSSDFMFDAQDVERPYLIEFNGGPVLFDATLQDQVLATRGLQRYHKLYQMYGEAAPVNDHLMIRDGLRLGLEPELALPETRWEKAASFTGTSKLDRPKKNMV